MRFRKEIRFRGDLDTVAAMLVDPDFRTEVARAAGARDLDVSVEETPDGVLAVVDTESPTDGFPAAATAVLGSTLRTHQEELWTTPTHGTLAVTIPGKPGQVDGTLTLRQDGADVVQTVDAEVRVKIPFVGGKVEAIIGSALGSVLSLQESVGADWLARR